ncbi:MAG TPA: hypothetical protein VFF53_11280 [Geobacteraceae bacterium]|nr:hypothetical protein [Geobacteraceae bacterium]
MIIISFRLMGIFRNFVFRLDPFTTSSPPPLDDSFRKAQQIRIHDRPAVMAVLLLISKRIYSPG